MEISAQLNKLPIAPRKVRLAARLIQGKSVSRATLELAASSKRSAPALLKLLRSATANAGHNFSAEKNALVVKEIRVDGGVMMKRFRPRAFGRAAAIRRRSSRVSLVLTDQGHTKKI